MVIQKFIELCQKLEIGLINEIAIYEFGNEKGIMLEFLITEARKDVEILKVSFKESKAIYVITENGVETVEKVLSEDLDDEDFLKLMEVLENGARID